MGERPGTGASPLVGGRRFCGGQGPWALQATHLDRVRCPLLLLPVAAGCRSGSSCVVRCSLRSTRACQLPALARPGPKPSDQAQAQAQAQVRGALAQASWPAGRDRGASRPICRSTQAQPCMRAEGHALGQQPL
jgi:hypothetical protein